MEEEPDELKRAIESEHGGMATLVQVAYVRGQSESTIVWQGMVYIFDLSGNPKATRAYGWCTDHEGGGREFHFALHMGPVKGPVEAVQTTIANTGPTK